MSELLSNQAQFSQMVAALILQADSLGYDVTLGEAWRPPEMAQIYANGGKGSARSLHQDRLAIDINLFKDGEYLTETEDYQELGEWWETLGGAWGGRFGDGNHFSLAYGGRK